MREEDEARQLERSRRTRLRRERFGLTELVEQRDKLDRMGIGAVSPVDVLDGVAHI